MENKKYLLETQNSAIYYSLIRTKRKTIGITVDINGEVKISVPLRISENQIAEVVEKRSNWILKKLREVQEIKKNEVFKQYVNGEKLLYLGKEYELKVVEQELYEDKVRVQSDIITVYLPQGLEGENKKQIVKEELLEWYKKCFVEIIGKRIKKYSLELELAPHKVVIKDQKTIWGSCSSKGNINLNWKLVMAPISIIDYVVVHEMCHLKVMNHSKDFWDEVGLMMPDYIQRREWLKINGHKLKL
ncbi:SprT family zinc-dependent metalloprotease [Proteiniborus sp. MB09-C3]|uniref:M48 family metallopeptidase n=1 Tax=Proteiniborus sp. MB09-C3 TaxID=3050072 RepID=UPI00255301B0|nr:SprT family zinc-dependent metalloprotease [Proteiniborus sp. MB09-C3]WIV11655.1 SprT family zinc-dependent metalloprotease [Proteiniborus sp. MB09-C3]